FNIPVDHLFAGPVVMIDYLKKKDLQDPVLVSPDAGGVERARAIAKRLNASLAIIDKRRDKPGAAVAMNLIGDVDGRDGVVIDDMIDTAGTLVQAVTAIQREGARRILACGIHAVLSGPAIDRIKASPIEEVVVTNSIPLSSDKRAVGRITVLTVAPLLGEAIRRIHDGTSVSTLSVKRRGTKEPAMTTPEITVKRREGTGKGIARRLRREGAVPAILYGGAAPQTITVNPRDVLRIIHGREGTTQLLSLKFDGDGGARMAIIRDMQFDPVTEQLV